MIKFGRVDDFEKILIENYISFFAEVADAELRSTVFSMAFGK